LPPAPKDLEAFVRSAASLLELKLDDAWVPQVMTILGVIFQHGSTVEAVTLPDDAEPAPVFEA
jgi:hypothetical protein